MDTYLVVTIDTEEDNWGDFNCREPSLSNIDHIPALQAIFDKYNVKPTYLITYPVATSTSAVEILGPIAADGRCEIGAHCHPWNTPPIDGETSDRTSMLCNLPYEEVYKKISSLDQAIRANFKLTPLSFRAGRWGFGPDVALAIKRLGYIVDTSVSPYVSWAEYLGPDFSNFDNAPFAIQLPADANSSTTSKLIEIPASTGFLQRNFALAHRTTQILKTDAFRRTHALGILSRAKLLNKAWLSPEQTNAQTMIRLTENLVHQQIAILNVSFHSTALVAGLSPFVRTRDDEITFYRTIETYFSYLKQQAVTPLTLSDAATRLMSNWSGGIPTRNLDIETQRA